MIIAAKSGVSLDQMHERFNKGAKYLELHLLDKDIDNEEKIESVLENIKKSGLTVKVLHTPIDRKYKLEGLCTEEGFKIIDATCDLANKVGKLVGETTYVVIHMELNLEQLKLWGLYAKIVEKLKYLLNRYPYIVIDIENETIIELSHGKFEMKNSFYWENVDVCNSLRNDLGTHRIGVVLDTCHAISSIRMIEHLINDGLRGPLLLKDYFKNYSDYVDIIHFSNARGYGHNENHGVGFDTEEECLFLEEMLGYIQEINFNGVLTLEVQEQNYLDVQVFPKLYKQINEIIKN